ncbi:MAG TPA: tetratricopeptide repeat protein, partial [Ktedonobacteraceae bacterium]|nr:tetratricopeptide repeat protein [Ktedonobacteraceae bacterium]
MVAETVRQQLTPQQRQQREETVIQAYTGWLDDGNMSDSEAGSIVTELTVLLLTHHCFLEAAQLLIRCGWLSFKLGYGPRLASLAQKMLRCVDWHQTIEDECAGLVLVQILFPFLGKPVETRKYINYQRIHDGFLAGEIVLQDATEGYVMHLLLLDVMDDVRFEDAQAILDIYRSRLESRRGTRLVPHSSLLQKQALLLGRWCEYVEEQGDAQKARVLREQAIALYRQRVTLLSSQKGRSPLKRGLRNRGLASCLSYLGYHLARIGQYEEALQVIERAIDLQERGYAYVGVLAASYSDKSQILIELGRFQEAMLFDEKAFAEIQRCVNAGDG